MHARVRARKHASTHANTPARPPARPPARSFARSPARPNAQTNTQGDLAFPPEQTSTPTPRRYARCAERNFASLDKGTASIENGDLGPDGKPAREADGMLKHLNLRQFGHPARELLAPCSQLVEKLSKKLQEMSLEMKDGADTPRGGGGGGGGKKKGGGGKGGKKKGKK